MSEAWCAYQAAVSQVAVVRRPPVPPLDIVLDVGGRLHEVDYADTVSDLESVARRLLAACGLEWDPACLEFYRTQRSVRTGLTQVRQPIYTKSLARRKKGTFLYLDAG